MNFIKRKDMDPIRRLGYRPKLDSFNLHLAEGKTRLILLCCYKKEPHDNQTDSTNKGICRTET